MRQDDGAMCGSAEGGDSSPHHQDRDCDSPPPHCPICLGAFENKAITDVCRHEFCFGCLVSWSKLKQVCPICRRKIKIIIHNIRSEQVYEEYMVEEKKQYRTAHVHRRMMRMRSR